MKGLRLLSALFLIGLFSSDALAAKPKILLLKDLQPGTQAIGFSVFKGVEPEPFDVVLGETFDNGGNDFILARISGGPMDTPLEKIGAIAGMSGSPIFINCSDLEDCVANGTLVGALSYNIGYFIEGGMNCLLTPAEYMLGARASGYKASATFYDSFPNEIIGNGNKFTNLLLFSKMEDLLSVAEGFSGVQPVAGRSSGRCKESVKSDIKPGSMVSVFLGTGDFNIGGSGTVTWRDGNDIYIFGHPFNGTGMVKYPFVQVSVADTLQTPSGASKLVGCSLDTKGAILLDGAFEVSGVVGGTAPMLPYQVELHMGSVHAILHEQIASSPIAKTVILKLPAFWAEKLLGNVSNFSVAYQFRIAILDQPEIFVRNVIPVRTVKDPFDEVFAKAYSPLQKMNESGFRYGIESIKVRLEIIKGFEFWTVKKSFLSQKKANPGETVYANVVLEEFYSSNKKQISIPIQVPKDFIERAEYAGVPHQIDLLVQSGNKFTDKRIPAETDTLSDFIGQLNQSMNYKPNVLYIQQVMPKSKAEQEADVASAKVAVKPAWKWTEVGEGDLKQFPSGSKNEVVLTISPPLSGFIDLKLDFDLQIEEKKNTDVHDKKEIKHKKWFGLF